MSGYDWNKKAENTIGKTPKLPPGEHVVECKKIITTIKGETLRTRSNEYGPGGDLQIMVIWSNAVGECADYLQLEARSQYAPEDSDEARREKLYAATWRLRRIIDALGKGEDAKAVGVSPQDFGEEATANHWLKGAKIRLTIGSKGYADAYASLDAKRDDNVVGVKYDQSHPDSVPF